MNPLPPSHREEVLTDRFVLAVDIGQSIDSTAIAVIHHRHARHIQLRGQHDPIVHSDRTTYDVRHLARLPLGLSYVDQVSEVQRLLARPPLNARCDFCLDDTGVGRAVGDLFDSHGMQPTRITITGAGQPTSAGLRRFRVPKATLISLLDAKLHLGELRIAKSLTDAGALAEELKDFRRKVSAAGRFSFEARQNAHDDLVLAVAIGLWFLAGRPKPPVAGWSTYSASTPPNIYGG